MTAAAAISTPVGLHGSRRRPALVAGLALTALAAAVLLFPVRAPLVIGAASGWALWLASAVMLGFVILMFKGALRLAGLVAAVAAGGLGAWLTFHPTVGALAAALLLAAALVMDGAFQFAAALHLRPLAVWRWLLASALTSLVAAALLAVGLPDRTSEAVAELLAAALATSGAALVALSFTRRTENPQAP